MPNATEPLKVFISYTHKDKTYKEKLITHLNSLIRQKYITLWYDNMILPGSEIDPQVAKALKESQIVLLLISADYLSSYYCYEIEMTEAMKLRQESKVEVIPVLLRPVDLRGTPFDNIKSLPEDRKAVSLFANKDEAYENIAKGLRQIAETWYARPAEKGSVASKEQAAAKESHINYGLEIHGNINGGNFTINHS